MDAVLKPARLFSRLFEREKKPEVVDYSRYGRFLDSMDASEPDYDVTRLVVDICDEALIVTEKRVILLSKIKALDEKLYELRHYTCLGGEDISRIRDLLSRFANLTEKRRELRAQLDASERSLGYLAELEGDAPAAVVQIQEAEEKQRAFKRDLGYLEGEKSDLEFQAARLLRARTFIRSFTVIVCVCFGTGAALLAAACAALGVPVLAETLTLIGISAAFVGLLYAFSRRAEFAAALNVKKRKRAVELINKKTVLYAHYTNFLNYEYRKFKVRSGEMLKNNIEDFAEFRRLTARLDAVRTVLYETETEIETFLKNKDLYNPLFSIDKLNQIYSGENSEEHFHRLTEDKERAAAELDLLNRRHEALWEVLVDLSEKDGDRDSAIKRILKRYIEDVGAMMQ
ncbi:MAG: hypothetical protein LBK41_04280 [Clostridiales bacterium]|jgi:hypothetical protein|nr:hypothetical protein [Clostridiales bacterium]